MVAEKRIYSTTALQNCYRAFFDPDMSPAKDYLDMVKGKKVTKRQLDIQLRNCKQYLLYQFDELEKSVAGIPTEKTS